MILFTVFVIIRNYLVILVVVRFQDTVNLLNVNVGTGLFKSKNSNFSMIQQILN